MPTIATERELSQTAGVTHPENLPFLLSPEQSNQQGVLLVHGFGATPREMRALAEHLCREHFTVFAVCLPGHGTSPEDLSRQKVENWLAATERGYQLLQQLQPRVSAVGLSTGCLLLLQLSLHQQLDKLVLLSPYLKLKHPLADLAGLLSPFVSYHHRQIAAEEQPFYYRKRPLKGIVQLNRLRKQTGKILHKITTPTLTIASKGDQTIAPGTAEKLHDLLGCTAKEFHCYDEKAPHVLTSKENPYQIDVFQRTAAFLSTPQ